VDGLWATKSKGVGLIVRAITFQDFQPGGLCKTIFFYKTVFWPFKIRSSKVIDFGTN